MYSNFGHNLKELSAAHCGAKCEDGDYKTQQFLICWVLPQEYRCPALPKRCNVLLNVLVKCLFSHTELPALCTFNDPSVFLDVHPWSCRIFLYFSPMPLADHCSPSTSPQHWKRYKSSTKCFPPPAPMSHSKRNSITTQHSKETTAALWLRTMA